MNNIIKPHRLLLATLVTLLTLLLLSTAQAQGELDSEFDYQTVFLNPAQPSALISLKQRLSLGNTARGNFTQYRHLKVLTRPLLSQGKFIFSQDKGMVWQQLSPFSSSLILQQGRLIQKDSLGKVQIMDDTKSASAASIGQQLPKLMGALLAGDIPALEQSFHLYYYKQADNHWQLGLKAKDKLIAKAIPSMILEGDTQLKALIMLNNNGDSTRIEFSSLIHGALTSSELAQFNPENL